jgi:hypothetical protein
MAGKAKGVPRDTTMTLRLPRALHEQLTKAAKGRSVSEEIRYRLEQSLLNDWVNDPKTGELIDAVAEIARNVRPYYGKWNESPYAFAVFKVAVDTVLSKVRPKGEAVRPAANENDFLPGKTPEEAGRMLAGATIIARGL